MRKRKWTEKQLRKAFDESRSLRQILGKLGLKEAGGNYDQITKYLHIYNLDSRKLKGKGWSKGNKMPFKAKVDLGLILRNQSPFQSYKLKNRLFKEDLKRQQCEICGWAQKSQDGRIPLELDHVNGNRLDNRLENLRVLCPNCHSLQPTHRGRNRNNGRMAEWQTRST